MIIRFIKTQIGIILTLSLLLCGKSIYAQKEVQFSQFHLNPLFFNPAAAGSEDMARFNLLHRSQYAGYQPTFIDNGGAPSSQLLTANIPLGKLGVGFYALNDKIGALSQQDIQLSASYKIAVGGGNFSVGARTGLYRQAMDFDQLRPIDPGDPLIGTGTLSEIKPDVSVGVRYTSNNFYVGLAANHLLESNFTFSNESTNPLTRTFYFDAGVYLAAGYNWEIQPVVLVKATQSSVSPEGGVIVHYDRRLFGGITYRHQDTYVIAHAGVYLLADQSLRLSGAYDFVSGGNNIKSPSSYEIMLSYGLPVKKAGKKSIIRTPRFRF